MKSHNHIVQMLYTMMQNKRLPHALIFSGETGSPLIPTVRDFITYIHCTQRDDFNPCQQCASCTKNAKLIHPDAHCIVPIKSSIKSKKKLAYTDHIQDWKDFIQKNNYPILQDWNQYLGNENTNIYIGKEQIQYIRSIIHRKSFESQFKTVLVWLPETLHPIAANAMLKMVEEPPSHTFFMFVSHSPYQIIPTMRSRMWNMSLPKISEQEMFNLLSKQYPSIDQSHITTITHIARGDINLAQKILLEKQQNYFEEFIDWMRKAYTDQLADLTKLADSFHAYNLSLQKQWLMYALQMLRNVLLVQANLPISHLLATKEVTFCQKFSQIISFEKLEIIIKHVSSLYSFITRNAYAKLSFMHTSLKISEVLNKKSDR